MNKYYEVVTGQFKDYGTAGIFSPIWILSYLPPSLTTYNPKHMASVVSIDHS